MRQLCFFVMVFFMSVNAVAQERKLMPVDWKKISNEVKDNPQRVKDLVMRLSATNLDTTLTYQDRILAFYGQSFLSNDEEDWLKTDMYKQKEQGLLKECLATAKKMLDINPLNLNALNTMGHVLYVMAKDSTQNSGVTLEDAKPYFKRAMRIYNTIAMTGDGSEDHPFYVTKVSDEYCFMHYYLNLWKFNSQTATSCCDVFDLGESSEYYDRPKIHFEITRVYELERMMFQK